MKSLFPAVAVAMALISMSCVNPLSVAKKGEAAAAVQQDKAILVSSDFLKASGNVLKNNYGTGSVVNLRGTNLGGWLLQEGWMSPNGEAKLSTSGWNSWAFATANGSNTAFAIDGNANTRWTSGTAQASGQWFVLDLGSNKAFDEFCLDAGSSTGDYPNSFNVDVSTDNFNWTRLPAQISGTQKMTVHIPDQLSQRYLRVTLTSGKGNWWSIHDFSVSVSDEFTKRAVLTSRFGASTANSLIAGYHDAWIQAADLDNIKNMGMNVIRVPIYWQVLTNLDGTPKPDSDAFRILDWVVSQSTARGLYVILDFHGTPGGDDPWQSSGQMGQDQFWSNATYQDWVVQAWQRLATHYRGNATIAGYDLLNEPLLTFGAGENSAQVQQKYDYYNRLYNAVRPIDPDHLIILAAFYGFGQALPPWTYGWTNVMYQTHIYNFGAANDWGAQNSTIDGAVNDLLQYQSQWNVPVYAGEFWFNGFNDLFGKLLSALNGHNISWTNWAYKNRNPAGSAGADGVPNGTGWGFYLDDQNPIPDLNADSSSTIASKWAAFGTSNFHAQTNLINTFKAYTPVVGWSSLKASANASYVSADNYGGSPLVANRSSVGAWEEYQVVTNPDGSVSLCALADGNYVTADLNNGGRLIASAKGILGWEKFWKSTNADGTISLQSQANNQYVSADLNNGGVLYANRATVSTWEKFTLAPAP